MAEGRSNAAIAQRLFVTERAVARHTAAIFIKLDLQPSDDDNRQYSPSSPTWAASGRGACTLWQRTVSLAP